MRKHIPVLLHEVLSGLSITNGATALDGTVGGGGYTEELCKLVGEKGTVIGIDQDADAIEHIKIKTQAYSCTKHFFVANFRNLDAVLDEANITGLDACVFDLGFSSIQLEESDRGFSFQRDEPLTMTYEKEPDGLTAYHIVNLWREEAIANVLYGYGEERHAKKIARAIVRAREDVPIATTGELARIVEKAVGKRGKIHPATQTFQALRIAVNDELDALAEGLNKAQQALKPEGRLAIVSFHSLEDRIVKVHMREWRDAGYGQVLTKKPTVATDEEVKANPRARSAKLRIFEKH